MWRKKLSFRLVILTVCIGLGWLIFGGSRLWAAESEEVTPLPDKVTASSNDGSNIPANTVDNDSSTRWSASGDGQWIKYDLGMMRTITYVTIGVYEGANRKNLFELQTSLDGANWTTVWNGESSGTTSTQEVYDFTDTDARYVRYLGHQALVNNQVYDWNSLTEVDIYALPLSLGDQLKRILAGWLSWTGEMTDDGQTNSLDFVSLMAIPTLTPTPMVSPTPTPMTGGKLQFKSGFEADSYLSWSGIHGIDKSMPSGINNWDNIKQNVPWAKYQSYYAEGGGWKISRDPKNINNHVLHLYNRGAVGNVSRSQWTLKQVANTAWQDDGEPNLFNQQFYRFRIYIPEKIKNLYSYSESAAWFMIWESHAWEPELFAGGENTRYAIQLEKKQNRNFWNFRVVKQRPEGINNWYNCNVAEYCQVAVPFGEWFTMEIFFKYDETDGVFYVAIKRDGYPRQIVANFTGQTKHDQKLHDQMMFKLYHDPDYLVRLATQGDAGTDLYYDDFEIWSGYPPGY